MCYWCLPMSLEMLISLIKISGLRLVGSSINLLCKPECASLELAVCKGGRYSCALYATKLRVFYREFTPHRNSLERLQWLVASTYSGFTEELFMTACKWLHLLLWKRSTSSHADDCVVLDLQHWWNTCPSLVPIIKRFCLQNKKNKTKKSSAPHSTTPMYYYQFLTSILHVNEIMWAFLLIIVILLSPIF